MIKFFRHIRQQLLTKSKFGKYLLYAIGEIVLVVIGILIALQLNNLNERNKSEAKEIEILNDFKASLEVDLVNINRAIIRGEQTKASMEIVLTHLETNLPYSDSLKYHFGNTNDTWTAQINRSVFESLKSEGLTLISNKGLRQRLVRLYDELIIGQKERNNRYRDLVDEGSAKILISRFDEMWKSNYESWVEENDFADKNYTTDGLIGEMTPINYEKLKNDQEYLYFLKSLKNKRFWHMEIENKSVKKAIVSLLKNIEVELEIIK
ncbi:hypothetical protein GGR42_002534 [Saonia flava]|uniref:Uncharacterized protein n=1 Tax=Saonia flava TaxID=523696 RepID=A0A846R0U4_9FLAO|nr:DUF6090 family protein [Saonia flava]NJB72043.1 hypothetical protein [Saonia flava]